MNEDAERIAHKGASLVAMLEAEGSGFDPYTLGADARDAYMECRDALLSAGYLAIEHLDYPLRAIGSQREPSFQEGGVPTGVGPAIGRPPAIAGASPHAI